LKSLLENLINISYETKTTVNSHISLNEKSQRGVFQSYQDHKKLLLKDVA